MTGKSQEPLARLTNCATMPLYYFDIYNDDVTIDDEGLDLENAVAASERACREVRNLAAESIKSCGHLFLDHRIEVRDEQRALVATIHFGDAITIGKS
jgi:hypothetical protein